MDNQHAKLPEVNGSQPFAGVPGSGPAPLAVRLSIEANRGTPALASMIARILRDAGAQVTFGRNAAEMPERPCSNLTGLHVHIDRLTWVRDEESARWVDRDQNTKVTQ